MIKFRNLNRVKLWVVGFSLAVGLFHVFRPSYAKAMWDWAYLQKYGQDQDLQELDPFAPTHDLDASLLSYRLLGIGLMLLVGFILWY